MSIIELGAFGEFVAAVLVLVTLIYVAIQVRHGVKLAYFNTANAILSIGQLSGVAIMQSSDMATVMAKLNSGEALDEAQSAQAYWMANNILIFYVNVDNALTQGLLPSGELATFQGDLERVLHEYHGLREPLARIIMSSPGTIERPIFAKFREVRPT